MRGQREINERMRAILVDWLIDVQVKFKLREETLWLTINLMDRYLERRAVAQSRLQLVGAAAMFLAAKYEEIFPPEMRDFVYVTACAYTGKDFRDMETDMLRALDFSLTVVTPGAILTRLCQLDKRGDANTFYLASYLLELATLEYRMLKFKPSLTAAAALRLAHALLKQHPSWDPFLEKYTGYTERDLKLCVKDMLALLHGVGGTKLRAAVNKYSVPERREVALIKLGPY